MAHSLFKHGSISSLSHLIKKGNISSVSSHLWSLTVVLYLLRTIAPPLKYLFFISFALLLINYLILFVRNYRKEKLINYLIATKEYHILGFFLVSAILISTQVEPLSLKGLINFLGISFILLVYFDLKDSCDIVQLLKGWVFFSILIGIVGILKWFSILLNLELALLSKFSEGGTSLVADYNFYACYFIISIIIFFYLIHKNIIVFKVAVNLVVLMTFTLNLILSGSRRGLIAFTVLLVVGVSILIINRNKRETSFNKSLFFLNVLFLCLVLIFIALVPFRFDIVKDPRNQRKITSTIYRYSTIFLPGIKYNQFKSFLWPQSAVYEKARIDWDKYITPVNNNGEILFDPKINFWDTFQNEEGSDNLLYNGKFEYGTRFWVGNAPDSISHEIISTKFGKAIRVSRGDGKGHWPLLYKGRKIYYHKGAEYKFRFKFRVIKGNEIPFMIGWGVDEGDGYKINLKKKLHKLDHEWYECTCFYRFKEDHKGLFEFMNSQMPNTIIDFADIQLTCDSTFGKYNYADEHEPKKNSNLLYNSDFRNGLKFWESYTEDRIQHSIIETEIGKAIRVERKEGIGGWSLAYRGRDIFYHKGLTYTFSFKFRTIKGDDSSFMIGWAWWDEQYGMQIQSVRKNIYPIGNGWFECICSYTFEQDILESIYTFMNNQESNTIIDFSDIALFCNDTQNLSMYIDENIELIKEIEESRFEHHISEGQQKLLSERFERWKYALELWNSEYNWKNKLFGKGFDYLEKYGQAFYPDEDRIDYPHNPAISAFLYSGILGGAFYIYFIVLSFWYYWKYRKHHMLFFILYLITFTFVFISSDSHFNVPIFAMLSLVPFITRHIVKEKEQKKPI